jgi:ABC-2 type transport system permease protein
VPIWLVGVEKILFGSVRGMAAALVATLIGLLVLPDVRWSAAALPGVLGVLALGGVVSAGIGLAIGASVPTGQISIVLTMAALLLMFTGSTTFPLLGLAKARWFQVICAVNPLSYVSEGLRALVVPGLRSVPLGIDLAVLAATAVLVVVLGVRCFVRRVVD